MAFFDHRGGKRPFTQNPAQTRSLDGGFGEQFLLAGVKKQVFVAGAERNRSMDLFDLSCRMGGRAQTQWCANAACSTAGGGLN